MNKINTKALDFTKPLQTRSGLDVELITTKSRDSDFPIMAYVGDRILPSYFDETGKYFNDITSHEFDLENVPEKKVAYVNIHPSGSFGGGWDSRAEADAASTAYRIACIKVEYTEGQFDE